MKKYLKSLLGFPVGNMLLSISYVLIYLADGNTLYSNEIAKLVEFKFMLGQFIFSGIECTIILFTIIFVMNMFNMDYKDKTIKNIWISLGKYITVLAIDFGICKIISVLLNRRGTLKGLSGIIFNKMLLLILIVTAIIYVVYQEFQNIKINNALKRKQNLNK